MKFLSTGVWDKTTMAKLLVLRRVLEASERDDVSLVSRENPSKNWLRNRRLFSLLSMMSILLLEFIASTVHSYFLYIIFVDW